MSDGSSIRSLLFVNPEMMEEFEGVNNAEPPNENGHMHGPAQIVEVPCHITPLHNFAFKAHVRDRFFFAGIPISMRGSNNYIEFESFDRENHSLKGQPHIKVFHNRTCFSLTMKNIESISTFKSTNASHPSCIVLHLRQSCGHKMPAHFNISEQLEHHFQSAQITHKDFALRQLVFILREEFPERNVITITRLNGQPVEERGRIEKLTELLKIQVTNRLKFEPPLRARRHRDRVPIIGPYGEVLDEEKFRELLEELSMDFHISEGLKSKVDTTFPHTPPDPHGIPSLLNRSAPSVAAQVPSQSSVPIILKKPQQPRMNVTNGSSATQSGSGLHMLPAGFVPPAGAAHNKQNLITNITPTLPVREVLQPLKSKVSKPSLINVRVIKTEQNLQHTDAMSMLAAVATGEHVPLMSTTPSTSDPSMLTSHPVTLQTQVQVPEPAKSSAAPVIIQRNSRRRPEPEVVTFEDDSDTDQEKQSTSNGQPVEKKPKNNNELFQYPSTGRDKMTVHYEDMRGLNFNEMLNDTIVDFFMKYTQYEIVPEDRRDKIHIMSSFFYKRLIEKAQMKVFGATARAASLRFEFVKQTFNSIRSWTKRIDIFSKDYIVVPIVDEMHWYMVIIVRPRLAVVQTKEEESVAKTRIRGAKRDNPDSYIVILDSLPDEDDPKRKCTVDVIRDYLELEFLDKKPMPGVFERSRLAALVPKHLPRQMNYVDCGLFVLKYAQEMLKSPPTEEELPTFDWMKKYPNFKLNQAFYRYVIKSCVRSHCSTETWAEYETWKDDHPLLSGSGDTLGAVQENYDADEIDCARRPRRYSEINRNHTHLLDGRLSRFGNEVRRRRYSSLPARLDFVDRSKLHSAQPPE